MEPVGWFKLDLLKEITYIVKFENLLWNILR